MKKFYSEVGSGPAVGGGYVVLLDGRPVRTPEKSLMTAPTRQLADAIAGEWAHQGEHIVPETMPLTQILTTSIDRARFRDEMGKALLAYIDSDLLCYHADEPEPLRQEQEKLWMPWLRWFQGRFGVALHTTFALSRLDQPEEAHKAVRAYIDTLDQHRFTVLHVVTTLTGSIILGLAFLEGAITPEQTFHAALCEEIHYERLHDLEKYGLDPIEAKRRESMTRDLAAADAYLGFVKVART